MYFTLARMCQTENMGDKHVHMEYKCTEELQCTAFVTKKMSR